MSEAVVNQLKAELASMKRHKHPPKRGMEPVLEMAIAGFERMQAENAALKARVAELQAVVDALHPERLDEIGVYDEGVCLECGEMFALRGGCDPTPECDACAHALLARVRAAALNAALEAKKGTTNA